MSIPLSLLFSLLSFYSYELISLLFYEDCFYNFQRVFTIIISIIHCRNHLSPETTQLIYAPQCSMTSWGNGSCYTFQEIYYNHHCYYHPWKISKVSKLPQRNLTVLAGETLSELIFTPEEIKKTVQARTCNLRNRTIAKISGKLLKIFLLKGRSFNKSKYGKPDNSL